MKRETEYFSREMVTEAIGRRISTALTRLEELKGFAVGTPEKSTDQRHLIVACEAGILTLMRLADDLEVLTEVHSKFRIPDYLMIRYLE